MTGPKISKDAALMEGARVIGDVTIEDGCSLWYNCVVRGDFGKVTIGENSNIQDNSLIHSIPGGSVSIGKNVTVGHNCVLHGCTVHDGVMVGMGCIIMDGAVLEEGCVIGAGSLVTGNAVIPAGMLALGRPAKPVRPVTEEEKQFDAARIAHYRESSKTDVQRRQKLPTE